MVVAKGRGERGRPRPLSLLDKPTAASTSRSMVRCHLQVPALVYLSKRIEGLGGEHRCSGATRSHHGDKCMV